MINSMQFFLEHPVLNGAQISPWQGALWEFFHPFIALLLSTTYYAAKGIVTTVNDVHII